MAERTVDAELTIVAVHIPTVLDEADAGGGPASTDFAIYVSTSCLWPVSLLPTAEFWTTWLGASR